MSDINKARSCDVQVVFNGVDISVRVNKDLLTFSYVDNEEDETDDLQIKVLDREGMWLNKWLGKLTESAAIGGDVISSPPATSTLGNSSGKSNSGNPEGSGKSNSGRSGDSTYKVTATTGVNVKSNTTEKGKVIGKLPYGTVVTVKSFNGEYASITYSGKTGYIKAKNLKPLGVTGSSGITTQLSDSETLSRSSNGNSDKYGGWKIGDEVTATGNPQYSSWGVGGTPGEKVTNWKGKISNLNFAPGIPYPICVDYLGWFSEEQVQKANSDTNQTDGKASGKGLKISASICRRNFNDDGKDDILDCGVFELDGITADSSPKTVTIKATSVPYSQSIRQTLKSKSWENTTLRSIVQEIADKNGFAVMYEIKSDPKYSRIEQYRTSDIAFLSKLCHDCGASLKFSNNIIIIFDQSDYEKKKAVRLIKFGEEYERYRLSTGTNSTFTSCRVSYTSSNGAVISAVEYAEGYSESNGKNQCLEIHQKVNSISEAQSLAHKMLRLHNKFEYQASFTLPGDTALAAGCAVQLSGFGAWDGKYIIRQAKHSVSHSGYTTQIDLRKSIEQKELTAADNIVDTDEEIDALARQCIRGDWGNGQERYDRLTAAGHDYDKVQGRVNQIIYG